MGDLGTYHIKVEFNEERGFIYQINTGNRFTNGRDNFSPIDATVIKAPFVDEEELIACQVYIWTQGNYSCDCNLREFIADAYQDEKQDFECGDELKVKRLTLIRPDLTELVIYENNH